MGEMNAAGRDDGALLDRLRQGDGAAAALVMQRHNRALWRIARGILRDEAEAEEAVQDAYMRAFTSAAGFRGEASLSTWLARIVINEALRRLGRRRPTADLSAIAEGTAARHPHPLAMPPPTPEQAAARAQIRRLVEQAVDALPRPFRLVFLMRVVEQMSTEETAAALHIPPATVKTRLHRANQQLRQSLGAEFAAIFDGAFPFAGERCARLTAAVLHRLAPLAPSPTASRKER
jgi:RNA polymerase sigma-70 factor (ECF subfamily)